MANNRIILKRTNTAGRTPNTTGSYVTNSQYISAGELALNMADGILYSSNGSAVIEIGANNVNQRITNSLTIDSNKALRFQTVNTSAVAYFIQQNDDNFVFYTTNTSYGARPVYSIFANSNSSELSFATPVRFNGNVTALTANGSLGSAGQVLTSNGSTVYWSSAGGGSGTVTSVGSGNGLTGGTITNTGTLSVLANTGIVANATGVFVNATYIGTLTANNTSFVGSVSAANVVSNAQLSANLANYVTTTNLSQNLANYQTTAGLSANVAVLAANSATFANSSATNTFTIGTASYFVANGYFGIGTDSPLRPLHIAYTTGVAAANLITSDAFIITAENTAPGFSIISSANSSASSRAVFKGVRSRGTLSSPTAANANDSVISMLGAVFDGNTGLATAAIDMVVDGSVSVGVAPQRIAFLTGNTNSRTERMRIDSFGNVGIGNTAPDARLAVTGTANVSGNVAIGGITTFSGNIVVGNTSANSQVFQRSSNATVNVVSISTTASPTGGSPTNSLSKITTQSTGRYVETRIQSGVSQGLIEAYATNDNNQIYSSITGTATASSTAAGPALLDVQYQNNITFKYSRIRVHTANNQSYIEIEKDGTSFNTVESNQIRVLDASGANSIVNTTAVSTSNSVIYGGGRITLVSNAGIVANGSLGTAGQVLHSNGSSAYWADDDQGVTSVATGNGLTGGTITSTGTLSVLANTGIVANSTGTFVNATYIGTLSANNTSFLGGIAAASYVNSAQLSANLTNYQTTAGLSANVATLTANNTSFVGSVSAANVVSNAQLSGNLANYAALSGATFTGAVTVSNNLTVTGNLTLSGNTLIVGANNLVVSDAIISLHTPANLAPLTSNDGRNIGLAFHYFDTEDKHALLYRDNSTGRLQYHNDGGDPQTNSNPTGNNLGVIQANSFWAGNDSVFATTNSTIYTGTANNANNLGGVAAANYVRKDQNNDIVENIRIRFGSANQTDVNDGTIAAGLFSNGLNIVGTQTQAGTGRQISYYGTLIDRANAGASFAGAVTLAGLSANGSLGTAGHTLHSNGSSTYWAVDDQGVTSVATGNGMTGGTITSTGTISVLANTGIVANATGLFVNATYIGTLSSNSATFANSSVTNTFTVGTASYFVANGNLGIGTSTPTGKLTVEGNNIFLNATDASPRIEIFNRGTNTTTRFPAFTVTHYTGNSTGGDTGGQPVIELNRFRGSVGSLLPVQSGDILGGYNTWGSNSTASLSATRIQGIAEAAFTTTATAGLQFFTTSAGTQSEKVRITASGNVGIGNTTPNNRLTVQKAAGQSVEGELYLTEGTYWTQFNSRSSAGAYNPLVQAGDHSIIYTDGAANTGALVIGQWSPEARGIRIDASGNVGISNSAPNARLAVTGTANVSGNVAIAGITTFSANVVLGSSGLSANGGFGTAGQVLTTNGTATYWATATASVNTAAQFAWTNTHTFSANVTIGNSTTNNNALLISQIGISNPNSFTGGTLTTVNSLNTLIVGPYTVATGNTLNIVAGSRIVIV